MEPALCWRAAAEHGLRMMPKKRNTDAAANALDGNGGRGAEIIRRRRLRLASTPRESDADL